MASPAFADSLLPEQQLRSFLAMHCLDLAEDVFAASKFDVVLLEDGKLARSKLADSMLLWTQFRLVH